MSTDFQKALYKALGGREPITERLVASFSSPTLAEVLEFRDRLARERGGRKQALFAAMVRHAEEHFRLDFSDLFRAFLDDPDPIVRFHAIEGLWEDERPDLVRLFVRLLESDPDVVVRAAAALSLGRFLFRAECDQIDSRRALAMIEALRNCLERADEDVAVRRRALESLAYVNEQWVSRLIDRAYQSGDERMRESAVFAMGRNADPMWADTVVAELYSDSLNMRYEAARACGELELSRAVDRLIHLTEDPDAEIAEMAIWALGQIGGKGAREALEQWATGDDEAMRAAAHEALEEIEFATRPLDLFEYEPDEKLIEGLSTDDDADYDEADGADYSEDGWDDNPLDLN